MSLNISTFCVYSAASLSHICLGSMDIISRIHAEVTWDEAEQSFFLTCRSKNGCIVDGKQVSNNTNTQLKNGSAIKIGDLRVYFLLPVLKKEKSEVAKQSRSSDGRVSSSVLVDQAFKSNKLEVKHGGLSQKDIVDFIISSNPDNYDRPEKRKALNCGVHKLLKRKYQEIEVPNPKEGKQPFLFWTKK